MSRLTRTLRRTMVLGVCATALIGTDAALADSTNPDYPGSVLHVAISGPLQAKRTLTIVASGTNAQHEMYPQAYSLWVYAIDPTRFTGPCPASQGDMEDDYDDAAPDSIVKLTPLAPTEGTSGTFTHDIAYTPEGYGPLEVCAYTTYVYDTAANAVTEVKIAAPGAGATGGSSTPLNRSRPRITESGNTLTCHAGSWTGTRLTYRYRWSLASRPAGSIHSGARFEAPRSDRAKAVLCTVTAASGARTRTATSPAFTVK